MNKLNIQSAVPERYAKVIYLASKFRVRVKSWMREVEYVWHLVHTDYMADTFPREAINGKLMGAKMNLGGDKTIDLGQGPPKIKEIGYVK